MVKKCQHDVLHTVCILINLIRTVGLEIPVNWSNCVTHVLHEEQTFRKNLIHRYTINLKGKWFAILNTVTINNLIIYLMY